MCILYYVILCLYWVKYIPHITYYSFLLHSNVVKHITDLKCNEGYV